MLSTLEYNYKNSNNKTIPRAFSKVSLLFLMVIFIYLSVLNVQIYLRNKDLIADEVLMKTKLQRDQLQNNELKKELFLFTEANFLERIIREKLGLVKPGETAFRIVE
ncbi:MAG: hypothetical protein DKM50_07110 [Candidatus Margulisiibacteriota bacterium]|nr:MAG: hypothetical protein A2X43_12950 [Candidatus Margulisbacteria bacterium GWD2_39_127]PZM79942.1 MAG: hypothetical protein DKM50_07110 [Candidatus Margulisiibacteriota bacterium]HAR62404.1 hypothetical protein [Candidatus Margulisiibacteriota bacterium]HCY37508.1 hypothetical protein [Candidatus Margulisiibacteriota bacterium]